MREHRRFFRSVSSQRSAEAGRRSSAVSREAYERRHLPPAPLASRGLAGGLGALGDQQGNANCLLFLVPYRRVSVVCKGRGDALSSRI